MTLLRVLIVMAFAGALSGQDTEDSGVVVVSVIDALTHAPLAETNVRIRRELPTIPPYQDEQSTGADGTVTFEALPAGNYRVMWERKGYTSARENIRGERVRLPGGETTQHLTLRLSPLGSLAGQVLDEDGQPMQGVKVYLRAPGVVPNHGCETDTDGRFRAPDLPPADYTLLFRASYLTRLKTVRRDPDSSESYGYPETAYYPDGASADGGVRVHLPAGANLSGLDLRLRRIPLVQFTGTLLDRATREPLRNTRIRLAHPGLDTMEGYSLRAPANGVFYFDLLEPGRYELGLIRESPNGEFPLVVPVEIGKAGITDALILPPPFQKLTGGFAPLAGGEKWTGSLVLIFRRNPGGQSLTIKDDGDFVVEAIAPGEWRLEILPNLRRISDDKSLAIASVHFGQVDALAGPFQITESGNPPIVVTLTADTGGIDGLVNPEIAARTPTVFLRRAGNQRVEPEYVRPDGSFSFRNLAPGAYELACVAGLLAGALEAATCKPLHLDVKPGETAQVRLDSRR